MLERVVTADYETFMILGEKRSRCNKYLQQAEKTLTIRPSVSSFWGQQPHDNL